jgi:hypothetical protein
MMRKFAVYMAIVLFVASISGCGDDPYNPLQDSPVPPEATDVVLYGKHWYSFRLYVGGKARRFLMHRTANLGGNGSSWTETLVELQDDVRTMAH